VRIRTITVILRPEIPAQRGLRGRITPPRRVHHGMCSALLAFTTATLAVAPSAVAQPNDTLKNAVVAARAGSCGPLRSDPVVDHAAEDVNGTTDKWIDHAARVVPETNALAVLKDLGYRGTKAAILSGVGKTDANAIKATLLQGYDKIPDCSYTDYGVSALHNKSKDMILVTVVLAA
jgi:hypothetical protein